MSGRLQILVLVACGILLLAIAFPSIEIGRQAARQMQSHNNLKQLGLAFHSYLDTYRQFPLGADADDLGPKHGWYTRLMPYIVERSTPSMPCRRFGHTVVNQYRCGSYWTARPRATRRRR